MKTPHALKRPTLGLITFALCTMAAPFAQADEAHDKEAGPNGGRLIMKTTPHVEFFVTDDRKAQLTFVDQDGEIIAPADQEATLVGGSRANPTELSFERQGDALLSTETLPDGNRYPLILQLKMSPDSEIVRERFTLNTTTCPGCGYGEYACICDH